ncbi:hypothetical protein [Modestobacter sp. URMC 112]
MEIVLVSVVLVFFLGMPVAAAVVPPVVMAVQHRWPRAAVLLWVSALGLLAGWVVAGTVDVDRADTTGGTGSWLAGLGWLIAAAGAATASVVVARRRAREAATPAG